MNFDNDTSIYPYFDELPTLSPDLCLLSPSTISLNTTPASIPNWTAFDASLGNVPAAADEISSPYETGQLDNSSPNDASYPNNLQGTGKGYSYTEDEEHHDKGFSTSIDIRKPSVLPASRWQMISLDLTGTRTDDATQFNRSSHWGTHMPPTYTDINSQEHSNDTTHMNHRAPIRDLRTHKLSSTPYTPRLRTADPKRHPSLTYYQQGSMYEKEEVSRRERTTTNEHNEVEKRYRNRLNGHFSELLDEIPIEIVAENGFEDGSGKAITKAEILMMAEQYIKKLEGETKDLAGANEDLLEEYENLKKALTRQGGFLLPS